MKYRITTDGLFYYIEYRWLLRWLTLSEPDWDLDYKYLTIEEAVTHVEKLINPPNKAGRTPVKYF